MSRISESPAVTVIIQTYNHSRFIRRAVESVLAQKTPFDYEVVILDDCSPDGTAEIVLEYARQNPRRVRAVIAETNRCDNTLFMEAWQSSRAPYVALLDGDDSWISPEKLRKQVELLDAYPDCALCFHDAEIWSETESRVVGISNPPARQPFLAFEDLLPYNFISSCSAMIRRETVPSIPPWFEGLIFGDWPLFLLAMRHGSAGYIPEVMARYRQHSGGLWTGLEPRAQIEQMLLFFDTLLGRLGTQRDEPIHQAMSKWFKELAFERESEPEAARTPARVREIEERLWEKERENALRVVAVVPASSPDGLLGASIDSPKAGWHVDTRSLNLAGWALGKEISVSAVDLLEDGRLIGRVDVKTSRPDVGTAFPEATGWQRCGFLDSVRLEKSSRRLALHAVGQDGNRWAIGEICFDSPSVAPP
jgi:glycosyltransferase involved in cell wall biosynthesis